MTNESRFLDYKLRHNMMLRSFTFLFGMFLTATLCAHAPAFAAGPNAITLDFTKVDPSCHSFTDGTATANPSGGQAPYGFAWDNGQMGQTNLGLTAGTYQVTVTDDVGETAVGSVTLVEPNALLAGFAPYATNCGGFNGPLEAQVSGGVGAYTYEWSTGETTPSITNLGATTYYLTVTDAQGCSAIMAEYIAGGGMTLNPTITSPTCHGESNGSIYVDILGSNGPFTYTWANGISNQPLTNITAGTYALTMSDASGCTQTQDVFVYDYAPLNLLIEKEDAICFMACDGVVKVNATGGLAPYTYTWSNGFQGGPINTSLAPGWYYLTVSDANGCSKIDSAFIYEPPIIDITTTSISGACGGASGSATVTATGGTPPFSYQWNYNGITGPTLPNAPAGTYVVLVTDANGCQKDKYVQIGGTTGLVVNLNVNSALCTGVNTGTAAATVANSGGSGSYSYAWDVQPGINAPSINGLAAGSTVSVTVTDTNTGCQGIGTATISGHTQVDVTTTDGFVSCANNPSGTVSAVASNGTAPYNYVWQNNMTSPSISGLAAGAYGVTVTDANGCVAYSGANVGALSTLNADFQADVDNCVNSAVEINVSDNSSDPSSSVVGWAWNIAWSTGSVQSTDQNPGVIPIPENETATIQLTVTSAEGCTDMISELYTVGAAPVVSLSSNDPSVSCDGSPVNVLVNSNAGANYTYNWTPAAGVTQNGSALDVTLDPSMGTFYSLSVANGFCVKNLDLTIITPSQINLVASAPVVSCKTSETISASAGQMVDFEWFSAGGASLQVDPATQNTTLDVIPNGMDIYTVVATDQYGCTTSKEVSVSGDALDISLTPGNTIDDCENTPILISYTNNDPTDIITSTWTSSSPNLTIDDPNASSTNISGSVGSYTITLVAENQSGCADTLAIAVDYAAGDTLDPFVAFNLCKGLDVGFELNNTVNGTWDFGDMNTSNDNNVTHTYTNAGTYNVTYTPNAACVATYEGVINVAPVPALDVDFNQNLVGCEDVALFNFFNNSTSTNGISSYTWSVNGSDSSALENPSMVFDMLGPISVTLILEDVNGCIDSLNKELPFHIVSEDVTPAQSICAPGEVELNPTFNADYNYLWSATPADPNLDTNSPNPTVSPTANTTYSVIITWGGCQITKMVDLEYSPEADLAVLGDLDITTCDASPVTLTANSVNGTVEWADNPLFSNATQAETFTITPIRFGTYYVRSMTGPGCEKMDTVKVHNGAIDVSFDNNTIACKGNEVELDIMNNIMDDNLTYSWDNGLQAVSNPIVQPSTTTTYTGIVGNDYGCFDTARLEVQIIELSLTAATSSDTICPDQTASLTVTALGSSNYTYEWSPSLYVTSGENEAMATVMPDESTTFEVLVTDENGCEETATVPVALIGIQCAKPYIFVPTAFTPNGDGENEFFMVRGHNITDIYFTVYDRWGEEMYVTQDPNAMGWDGMYKGRKLSPDSYGWYVKLKCDDGAEFIDKGNVTLLK